MTDATAPDVGAAPKGGFLKKLIRTILFAAVLGGGGFAAGMYMTGAPLSPSEEVLRMIEQDMVDAEAEGAEGPQKVAKDIPETASFQTSYYEFPDTLTTNLAGGKRYLQVAVGVSTQYDAKVVENIEAHSMALRSDMLAVLSAFSEDDVKGVEGRARLAEALKTSLNDRLMALEGFGGIEDVFFPSFMLQ